MRVTFYATLRVLVGEKTVDVPLDAGATVRDLAGALVRRWPELATKVFTPEGEISRQVHFMLDGRNIRWLPAGADSVIEPGQRVDVFPPTAGG